MTPTVPWRAPTLLPAPYAVSITERQADVLAGICHGHSSVQIADRLYLSEDTIKTHAKRLLAALGASNRAHAVALVCSGQVTVHVRDTSKRRAA